VPGQSHPWYLGRFTGTYLWLPQYVAPLLVSSSLSFPGILWLPRPSSRSSLCGLTSCFCLQRLLIVPLPGCPPPSFHTHMNELQTANALPNAFWQGRVRLGQHQVVSASQLLMEFMRSHLVTEEQINVPCPLLSNTLVVFLWLH
jgi:hypothetical protein